MTGFTKLKYMKAPQAILPGTDFPSNSVEIYPPSEGLPGSLEHLHIDYPADGIFSFLQGFLKVLDSFPALRDITLCCVHGRGMSFASNEQWHTLEKDIPLTMSWH